MTTFTTRHALAIRVHPGDGSGPAVIDIGATSYFAYDEGTHVRLEKFATQGGQVYRMRLGRRGFYGCDCEAGRHGLRCLHLVAAAKFLDATF